jgi:hypothetical protein
VVAAGGKGARAGGEDVFAALLGGGEGAGARCGHAGSEYALTHCRCQMRRPVAIGGRRYVDGGVCSMSNLDQLCRQDVDVAIVLNPISWRASS